MIKQELVNILACPQCKGPVKLSKPNIVCEKCLLAYPIDDGIPVMLLDKAKVITLNDINS